MVMVVVNSKQPSEKGVNAWTGGENTEYRQDLAFKVGGVQVRENFSGTSINKMDPSLRSLKTKMHLI